MKFHILCVSDYRTGRKYSVRLTKDLIESYSKKEQLETSESYQDNQDNQDNPDQSSAESGTNPDDYDSDDSIDNDIYYAITNHGIDYFCSIEYSLRSKKDYTLLILYGESDNPGVYKINEYDDYNDAETFCNYLYYKINGCKPFVETGMTSAYKETGYYPDLDEDLNTKIKNLNLYPPKLKQKFKKSDFVIGVVLRGSDIWSTLQCVPLF